MWWYLVVFVAAFVIAYATMPKPQRPTVGTLTAPTAEEGRPIPVLFGSRWIAQANVVWYGNIATTAVTAESGKK